MGQIPQREGQTRSGQETDAASPSALPTGLDGNRHGLDSALQAQR